MDPVSVYGFASAADAYVASRPHWPPAAVDLAFGHWEMDPGSAAVVDLAAGTGRLTEHLAARCGATIAVEPVAEMRAYIRGADQILEGAAERMPLEDASADAVFVGEAMHWFDRPAALREIARVLRPRGGLAILWNSPTSPHPCEAELRALLEPHHYHPQGRKLGDLDRGAARDTTWREGPEWTGWDPIVYETVDHVEPMTRSKTVTRIASFSYIGTLDDATRRDVLTRADAILADHGVDEFEQRWRTDVYLTRRAA